MTYRKKMIRLAGMLVMGTTGLVLIQWLTERLVSTSADIDARAQAILGVAETPENDTAKAAHPLDPALEVARRSLKNIETNIKDYSATMFKREQINGKLGDPESMFVKVRHQPFSVYTRFETPEWLKGQEAIYVKGKNEGNLLGHGVGIKKLIGTVSLKPDGPLAMQGQRYPITEIGILNLAKRLIEAAERDKEYGECEVKFFKEAEIGGRPCTQIEVKHPIKRPHFHFHLARVFIDDELDIPVRYEAYDWPTTPGGEPPLLEEYTYIDLKPNNGWTDADFDQSNPEYDFQ